MRIGKDEGTAPLRSRLRGGTAPHRSRDRKGAVGVRARRSGSALLMVLWVSAALAAVGFSLASTVRGEAERASTAVVGLRSYYLAVGGLERAMVELLWST